MDHFLTLPKRKEKKEISTTLKATYYIPDREMSRLAYFQERKESNDKGMQLFLRVRERL